METSAKPKGRLPAKTWEEIKHRCCAGVSPAELARVYGVSVYTVKARSDKERWDTPMRVARRRGAARKEKEAFEARNAEKAALGDLGNAEKPAFQVIPIDSFNQALAALVNSPPADFQKALGGVAQAAIAAGVPGIAPPQNLKDLATWIDIFRKTNGLDKPDKGAGITLLVNPMRTVSRRSGPVVEAEPAEYPAEDPAELDDWEP